MGCRWGTRAPASFWTALRVYTHRRAKMGPLLGGTGTKLAVGAQSGRKLGAGSKAPRPKTVRAVFGCGQAGHPARYLWAQLLARIYGMFPVSCRGCRGWVRLLGFITHPATVRQIPDHIGAPSTAPAIASACPPPQRMEFAQLLAAHDTEYEVISELEFDQMADLDGEVSHDPMMLAVDLGAEPISDLEFDQTLEW